MKVFIFNPPCHNDKEFILTRSYAGGYGTVEKKDNSEHSIYPPIELLTIARQLQYNKIEIHFRDYQMETFDIHNFEDNIKLEKYDVIISTLSLPSLQQDCEIAKLCKKSINNTKLFIYSNIIYNDIIEKALNMSNADAIIFPGSILNILDIINGLRGNNTAYISKDNELIIGEIEHISNVDDLPIASREIVEYKNYKFVHSQNKFNIATLMNTSYGCPNPCSYYCPYPLSQGNTIRMHSVERVIEEMKEIKKLGIDTIIFRDPVFSFNKDRIIEICKKMIDFNLNFTWWCETRIDTLDFELLKLMKKAGCEGVEVGVESGDEFILQKQAKVGLTLAKINRFKDWMKKLNLQPIYLFLLGLPMDTPKTIVKTIKLILQLDVTVNEYSTAIITPYPGTQLYSDAKKNRWLIKDWDMFTGFDVVSKTDNITTDEMFKVSDYTKDLYKLISKKEILTIEQWTKLKHNFIEKLEEWANNYKTEYKVI